MPRFETEWTGATRLVLVLTVLVAIVAIGVGIKDFVQQKKENAAPSTSSTTPVDNTLRKKVTPAKTRQARISSTNANPPATAQSDAENTEKPLIREVFPRARAKTIGLIDNASNTGTGQSAHDVVEAAMDRAAMDRNNRRSKQFESITSCVPLPNGTKPEDSDAAYYQNWAREYSCVF